MNTPEAVERICELAHLTINPERIQKARQRQAAMFAGKDADYIPLCMGARVPELDGFPTYDWREQWHDPANSFVEQMKEAIRDAASQSDAIPSIRADTGVINGPSLFGAQFEVPTHTKPVVTSYVSKETLADFELPADITALGVVPRIVEHMEHHLSVLKRHGLNRSISVHHCDTQGPFDIAEQTRGHELLTDFYEDPKFAHHLMAQSVKAYIALTSLCKRMAGDGATRGSASGYWMETGGIRICDDSSVLLSAELFNEFVAPSHAIVLSHFGGGWLHYCGGVPGGARMEGLHLHDAYLKIPHLCGLNFSTGKNLMAEVKKVIDHHVTYVGGFDRGADEAFEPYLRRVLSLCPGRKGILFGCSPKTESERAGTMDLWHRLQDETFGPGI